MEVIGYGDSLSIPGRKGQSNALSIYGLSVFFLWMKMFILYKVVFHINHQLSR